jgi:hypothetical protein
MELVLIIMNYDIENLMQQVCAWPRSNAPAVAGGRAGLIFVVDSNDTDRVGEAHDELHRMLSEDELAVCARPAPSLP